MPLEAPEVRVRRVELRVAACPTTEAVRFGADELRSVPVLTARVSAEIDGEPVDGYAAEPLLATWYESPGTGSSEELLAALAASARDAGWAFEGAGQGTLFELWVRARAEHVERDGKGLVQGFGIALVERAAMDAVCRARGFAFLNALRWNLLGFQPDLLAPELEGWNVSTSVQAVPPKRARARQTIRIDDALTSGPSSLTALIARYGVDAFEVELTGSPEEDLARLAELAPVLEEACYGTYDLTLHGNESFSSTEPLEELLAKLPPALLERVRYVVEPFPRAEAFEHEVRPLARPCLVDAADDRLEALPRALAHGYAGTTLRGAKGLSRALFALGHTGQVEGGLLDARDPVALPVLALHQYLALATALGVEHLGIDTHRWFDGLEHLPGAEQEVALGAHPDLYVRDGARTTLRVVNGVVPLGSLRCEGFGTAHPVGFAAGTLLADWTPQTGSAGDPAPDGVA